MPLLWLLTGRGVCWRCERAADAPWSWRRLFARQWLRLGLPPRPVCCACLWAQCLRSVQGEVEA